MTTDTLCVSEQVPNGELTAEQLRYLGDAIAPFGEGGCADITTRANIQLRGMTLAEADHIFEGLQRVGLSSVMSGAAHAPPRGLCLTAPLNAVTC